MHGGYNFLVSAFINYGQLIRKKIPAKLPRMPFVRGEKHKLLKTCFLLLKPEAY